MPSALVWLSSRAAQLYAGDLSIRFACSTPPPLLQHLSAFTSALGAVLQCGGDGTDDQLLAQSASACAQQLSWSMAALPTSQELPLDVLLHVFRILKSGRSFLRDTDAYTLANLLDKHFSTVSLALWKPRHLVSGLHAMARVGPSVSSFSLVQDVTYCLLQHLPQLTDRQVAVLLWSLVSLRMETSRLELWTATCVRCRLLLGKMNHISRATVTHAVLMAPTCVCNEQQLLLNELLHYGAREEEREFPLQSTYWDSDPAPVLPAEWSTTGISYAHVKSRLLASMPSLSDDMLLALLPQMAANIPVVDSTKLGRQYDLEGAALSSETSEGLQILLGQLSCRRLSAEHAMQLLDVLGPCELAEIEDEAAPVIDRAVGVLVRTAPSSVPRPHACLMVLTAFLGKALVSTVVSSLLDSSVADTPTTQFLAWTVKKQEELLLAILHLLDECAMRGAGPSALFDGATAWATSTATDLIAHVTSRGWLPTSINSASTEAILSRAKRVLLQYPSLWFQSRYSSDGLMECLQCLLCACKCSAPLATRCIPNSASHSVLTAVIGSLKGKLIPLSAPAIELLCVVERAPEPMATICSTLISIIVEQLDRPPSRALLLRDMTTLLQTILRTDWKESGAPTKVPVYLPDTLLELYVRLLVSEGKRELLPAQFDVLLASLGQRRGDIDALERAFLFLLTCRLGQSASLLETVHLPVTSLPSLIEFASILHEAKRPTSIAILNMLLGVAQNDVLSQCSSLAEVNEIASLLSLNVCAELQLRAPLARAVSEKAKDVLLRGSSSALEKAYLVAYFVRAGLSVEADVLAVLRQG